MGGKKNIGPCAYPRLNASEFFLFCFIQGNVNQEILITPEFEILSVDTCVILSGQADFTGHITSALSSSELSAHF